MDSDPNRHTITADSFGTAIWVITPGGLSHGKSLIKAMPDAHLYVSKTMADTCPLLDFLDVESTKDRHGVERFSVFEKLATALKQAFADYRAHVFIFSTGIAVRLIAPMIQSKLHDPAVVVMDDQAHHAVSLISGHLGGANELATEVSRITGATPVITTATDVNDLPSIDMIAKKCRLSIENPEMIKSVNMTFLQKKRVGIIDPDQIVTPHIPVQFKYELSPSFTEEMDTVFPSPRVDETQPCLSQKDIRQWVGSVCKNTVSTKNHKDVLLSKSANLGETLSSIEGTHEKMSMDAPTVWICCSDQILEVPRETLTLRPPTLVAGMGCNRNTSMAELKALLISTFENERLSMESLMAIATTAVKADEKGLLELAEKMNKPILFYEKDELNSVETIQNPSDMVEKHLGVKSVCEAAAILATRHGELIVPKIKRGNATLAVARQKVGFL